MVSEDEMSGSNESECVKRLIDLIKSEKFDDAKHLINSKDYNAELQQQGTDLVAFLVTNITNVNQINQPELFNCCEDIIYAVAENGNPDELLIDFIEHAEKNDDLLFSVMLKAMQIVLLRIKSKQQYHFVWCLNTIVRHISHMENGEDFKLEGEECILLENTDSSRMLEIVYKDVLNFSKTFIDEVLQYDQVKNEDIKNSFISFLLKLFGRPFVYMNLEILKIKGEFRLIAENIFEQLAKFKIDFMNFLNNVSLNNSNKEVLLDAIDSDYNNVSLAVFYYLIFKEELFLEKISHVYDPIFIFDVLVILATELLDIEHSRVQYKGLMLLQASVSRICDGSLNFTNFRSNIYGNILKCLCKIMIYSEVKNNRLIAVKIFKSLLYKFNSQGRFIILLNIQNKIKSPNFIGYIIPITKDLIMRALDEKNPNDLEYFTGENLRNLLKRFCYLHKGPESDLIELSDQIIASLNLLRYLLIRDRENVSGVAEMIPSLETTFLEPLRTGITLSVAHYKLQITEMENDRPDDKVTVSIAGNDLPRLPKAQQLQILNSALGTFDLMESLRARTQQCLEEFKQFHINK